MPKQLAIKQFELSEKIGQLKIDLRMPQPVTNCNRLKLLSSTCLGTISYVNALTGNYRSFLFIFLLISYGQFSRISRLTLLSYRQYVGFSRRELISIERYTACHRCP